MSLLESLPNKPRFPECNDDKVRIVEFSERHLTELYVGWLNDPVVVRYSEQRHHKHTLASCIEYFESQKRSPNYFLAIELVDSKILHIGNMGVEVDLFNNKADISIMIGEKSVWGSGAASRAWALVMNVLVQELGIRLVTAGTMETNIPMIKLMKRSGMKIDAILPNRFVYENKQVGLVAASYYPVNIFKAI